MARKRGRGRGPKRTSKGGASNQRSQKLSREVQELYADGDLEAVEERLETWDAEEGSPPPTVGGEGEELEIPGDARPGRVIALASAACRVEDPGAAPSPDPPEGDDEPGIRCVLPSRLARDQRAAVAVGDRVLYAPHGTGHRVFRVEPRSTTLSRPDPQNFRQERVIAANVDVVVIVASTARPPFRAAFVDRMLITVERGGAEPLLVLNKCDLRIDDAERAMIDEALASYRELGLRVLRTSAEADEGVDALRQALLGRTVVFVGHSGVGKSSLVNALDPSHDVLTGQVSRRFARGRHTTTRSRLYSLAGGIEVIDTPGIRELGLWRMSPEELGVFFPEFDEISPGCRFRNCTHSHEPSCAVRAAAEGREVDPARYARYLRILESLEED